MVLPSSSRLGLKVLFEAPDASMVFVSNEIFVLGQIAGESLFADREAKRVDGGQQVILTHGRGAYREHTLGGGNGVFVFRLCCRLIGFAVVHDDPHLESRVDNIDHLLQVFGFIGQFELNLGRPCNGVDGQGLWHGKPIKARSTHNAKKYFGLTPTPTITQALRLWVVQA